MASNQLLGHPSRRSHRHAMSRKLVRQPTAGGSDTEFLPDGDIIVPHCEAVLDNSQTLASSAVSTKSEELSLTPKDLAIRVSNAQRTFKYEILRLAHTLQLKGWRRVPLEMSQDINIERLSGALTNAVYVVSPPRHMPTDSNADASHLNARKALRRVPMYVSMPQNLHQTLMYVIQQATLAHIWPAGGPPHRSSIRAANPTPAIAKTHWTSLARDIRERTL